MLLDIDQAFNKVLYSGLLFLLKTLLPPLYFLFFKSEYPHFVAKVCSEFSIPTPILANVPPRFHIVQYIYSRSTNIHSYISSQGCRWQNDLHSLLMETYKLLVFFFKILELWYSKWKIKVNYEKCSHITFMLKMVSFPHISLFIQPNYSTRFQCPLYRFSTR